ncbi:MAG: hypothetical protein WBC85_09595 [Planktotalea sp.]|uniref:hypothetical protein n=1 Tax=Planktotalea sp. TaxID=2029877 RepID=UPI003C773E4F
MSAYSNDGFCVFDADPKVLIWANAAAKTARKLVRDDTLRATWLRHQETWFVGVDALPNAPDGSISGAVLTGPWEPYVAPQLHWHKAQISAVYKGYPKQDPDESEANHRFRIKRCAAHVDGILLENGRRFLREPHQFVLGIPLGTSHASPLVVWPGSHLVMQDAFRNAIGCEEPGSVELTQAYKAARAQVFERITPLELHLELGQSVLLHRHLLHGIAPWKTKDTAPPEGRIVAYFRPMFETLSDWIEHP